MSPSATVARCLRERSNWGKLSEVHKMDSAKFNPEAIQADIQVASPKLYALIQNILALDRADRDAHGHTFKHFIYSDIKSSYGAKLIASALVAFGFHHAYGLGTSARGKTFTLHKPQTDAFATLTTVQFFQRPLGINFRKEILKRFNARPDNIYGENLRIVILDSGLREGVDLFDVKYVHLFEPILTVGDQKQAVGRATRFCGQKGLAFDHGWPLHVYRYDTQDLFQLFLEHSNIDLKKLALAQTLEDVVIDAAVDRTLTLAFRPPPIHAPDVSIEGGGGQYKPSIKELQAKRIAEARAAAAAAARAPFMAKRAKEKEEEFRRNQEKLRIIMEQRKASQERRQASQERRDRLAAEEEARRQASEERRRLIAESEERRRQASQERRDRIAAEEEARRQASEERRQKASQERRAAEEEERRRKASQERRQASQERRAAEEEARRQASQERHRKASQERRRQASQERRAAEEEARRQASEERHQASEERHQASEERRRKASQERRAAEEEEERRSRVPPYPATVATMDAYVQRHFRDYTWPPIELTNGCAAAPVASLDFSPTQNFIRHYLTPASPYHGLLAFHSVGTGKTCLAIATATTTFEPEGWTILYVTKTTLKGDVWKNMFDQVCSLVLQEKLRNGASIPTDKAARMRMLSKSWSQIQPLSYRQFSNMLRGKSALATKLRAINGKHDPLQKTLVVIDEAHKLFVSDMPPSEKCDIGSVKKAIDHSYATSGTNAVKLLLMTGTPYTDDPMDMIKLLNLLFDPSAKLPETFATFAQSYLDADGHFTDSGHTTFSNQIAGYVSYLNREKDRRTFSYPIFYDLTVPMATLGHQDLQIAFDTHQHELNELEQTLKSLESGEAIQKMEAELKQCLQTLAQVQQCKTDATRHYDPLLTEAAKQCDRKAYRRLQQEHQAQLGQCLRLGADDCTPLKEALVATKTTHKLTVQTTQQHLRDAQKKLRDLKTRLQKHSDTDLSQRAAIQECLTKKNKPEE